MYQTEYSNLVEFGSAPTVVGFFHKVVYHVEIDHMEAEHKEVDHMEVDYMEVNHKEVDHTGSGDHIGRVEFTKKADHTTVGKVPVAFVVTVKMIVGKVPIGIGSKFVVVVVSKVPTRVEQELVAVVVGKVPIGIGGKPAAAKLAAMVVGRVPIVVEQEFVATYEDYQSHKSISFEDHIAFKDLPADKEFGAVESLQDYKAASRKVESKGIDDIVKGSL